MDGQEFVEPGGKIEHMTAGTEKSGVASFSVLQLYGGMLRLHG